MRIKLLKDCYLGRKGEFKYLGDGVCESLIRNGFAESAPNTTKSPRNKRARKPEGVK